MVKYKKSHVAHFAIQRLLKAFIYFKVFDEVQLFQAFITSRLPFKDQGAKLHSYFKSDYMHN